MKMTYNFKHIDSSEALVTHAREQLEKLERFELKPYNARFCFSQNKSRNQVDLELIGPRGKYTASAERGDFYHLVDQVIQKVERQLYRRKEQARNHKRPDFSRQGKLANFSQHLENPSLSRAPRRRAA